MVDHVQASFDRYLDELNNLINNNKIHSIVVYTQYPHHNGPIEYIDMEIARQIQFGIFGLGIVRFDITLK